MESTDNVPSIEEISFKLTQQVIPSLSHLPTHPPSNNSLDYTLSRVSIQHLLLEDEEPSELPPQIEQSAFWKKSSLKTTCTGSVQPSNLYRNNKTTFRRRILSSNKFTDRSSFKRKLSQHITTVGQELHESKNNQMPLHSPHPAPYRAKENKERSMSGRLPDPKKMKLNELFELHSSMKVTPINLQAHSAREKVFLRRVIQNRGSALHAIDEISQICSSKSQKKRFRIR